MEEQKERLEENDKKGRKVTVIVHLLLLLCFLFFGLTGPFPPPEEEGILISFGQPNVGSGKVQPTTKTNPPPVSKPKPKAAKPTPKVNTPKPKVAKPTPVTPVKTPVVESVIPEKVATQKTVEAPSVSPKKVEKVIEKPKEVKPVEKPVEKVEEVKEEPKEIIKEVVKEEIIKEEVETEVKEETQETTETTETVEETKEAEVKEAPPSPVVDPRALYGGSKSDKNSNSSQGDTGRPGDQGAENGDPNASNTKGDRSTGLGKSGTGSELAGRTRTHKPSCTDNSQVQGIIKVQIHVGSDGVVRRADFMQRGSSTTDTRLVQKAISCAKQYKYNSDPYAPEIQTGIVTFNFTF